MTTSGAFVYATIEQLGANFTTTSDANRTSYLLGEFATKTALPRGQGTWITAARMTD